MGTDDTKIIKAMAIRLPTPRMKRPRKRSAIGSTAIMLGKMKIVGRSHSVRHAKQRPWWPEGATKAIKTFAPKRMGRSLTERHAFADFVKPHLPVNREYDTAIVMHNDGVVQGAAPSPLRAGRETLARIDDWQGPRQCPLHQSDWKRRPVGLIQSC
jgi:hypothetical protein